MKISEVKSEADVIRFLEGWSDFEKAVYLTTFRIPRGKVTTYGIIARIVGRPRASRAVANALHNNPLYPVVPCWRVVRGDGSFGGREDHAEGRRRRVIEDGVPVVDGDVVMSESVLFREAATRRDVQKGT